HDGLGSPIGLVNAAGALGTRYKYGPFGTFTASGAANTYPFRMSGIEYDTNTALYHMMARFYSPTLQRFLSEDPIGYEGGDPNFFAYSGNNPISGSDPSGLSEGGGFFGFGLGNVSIGIGGRDTPKVYPRHIAKMGYGFSSDQIGLDKPDDKS